MALHMVYDPGALFHNLKPRNLLNVGYIMSYRSDWISQYEVLNFKSTPKLRRVIL